VLLVLPVLVLLVLPLVLLPVLVMVLVLVLLVLATWRVALGLSAVLSLTSGALRCTRAAL